MWKCLCECGETTTASLANLTNGNIKSCGCLRRESMSKRQTTHGMEGTPIYNLWSTMRSRCGNPNDQAYADYGGRGIVVCSDWNESFERFMDWAFANGYAVGLQIDRERNNEGYSPNNCRFVTPRINSYNRRSTFFINFGGRSVTALDLEKLCGLPARTIQRRISEMGWSVEDAISVPIITSMAERSKCSNGKTKSFS